MMTESHLAVIRKIVKDATLFIHNATGIDYEIITHDFSDKTNEHFICMDYETRDEGIIRLDEVDLRNDRFFTLVEMEVPDELAVWMDLKQE